MKISYKKIIILTIFIGIIITIRVMGWHEYLTFENLQKNKTVLKDFVSENYGVAVFGYIIAYTAAVGFSLPGATALTLFGGFLFGTILAAFYVNIGATVGACTIFLIARYILGDSLQKKYEDKLEKFNSELKKNGHSYLLTLRLIPLFPFFLINLGAGLTNIAFFTFAWTTAIGIIPGSLVFTYAGSQLETIDKPGDILSLNIFLAFVLLGVLALVPVIYKKIKAKKEPLN